MGKYVTAQPSFNNFIDRPKWEEAKKTVSGSAQERAEAKKAQEVELGLMKMPKAVDCEGCGNNKTKNQDKFGKHYCMRSKTCKAIASNFYASRSAFGANQHVELLNTEQDGPSEAPVRAGKSALRNRATADVEAILEGASEEERLALINAAIALNNGQNALHSVNSMDEDDEEAPPTKAAPKKKTARTTKKNN